MGILDDYMNGTKAEPAAVPTSSSLINSYMNSGNSESSGRPRVVIDTTPSVPRSGFSKEDSDALNAQPGVKGTPNNTTSFPSVGNAIYDKAAESGNEVLSGVKDIFGNQPASGLGKVGMGALGVLSSPLSGLTKVVGDVTGNRNFADKAELVAGGAIPIVPGVKMASSISPSNRALREVIAGITSDGANPLELARVVKEMKANPRLGPIDLSDAVLSMNQKLFVKEGNTAKNYLAQTSRDRMAGANNAVESAYNDAAGVAINPVTKLQELKDAAKKVGEDQINPSIKNASSVNITPVIEHIDSRLKPGVQGTLNLEDGLPSLPINDSLRQVRAILTDNKSQRVDPSQLHSAQSILRQTAEGLLNSATGSDREMGHALMGVRNKIVTAIDEASGGKYKPALSNFRDEKQIGDAFHHGYDNIFTTSKKLENSPEFTREWVNQLSERELEAAREGARLRLNTEIKSVRSAASNPANKATSIPEVEFNRQKLEIILGKEKTDQLLTTLKDEKAIANTHNKLEGGSQTGARLAADSATDLPVKNDKSSLSKYAIPAIAGAAELGSQYLGGSVGLGGVLGLGASVAGWGINKAGSAAKHSIEMSLAKERNAQIAKYSLPVAGPARDALIKQLEAAIPGPKQSLLNRSATNLSRIISP
jgi:hypothetical protein